MRSNYMININDLSVGDWVFAKVLRTNADAPNDNTPVVIDGISDRRYAHDVTVVFNQGYYTTLRSGITPIPITPEMLEQNGCTLAWHYRGALKYECEAFSATQERDRWTIACNDIVATIQYVHQLQHLLRIAGATKEINL